MTGAVRVRGEAAEKVVRFDEGQLDQLALALSQRLAEPRARWTFHELAARWLQRVKRVRLQDEQRNVVQLKPLWHLKEGELTPAAISEWFSQLEAMGFSPISINKYRCAGRLVVREAQAEGQWGASNPFDLVKRMKEPRKKYELLTLDQARAVWPHLRADHRRMMRLTIALGFRTGELFALRKTDVDFQRGVIYVRRSHGRDTTKTGVARTIPLLGCIAGDLVDAMRESQADLLFPSADGELKRADTKMCRVLRTAMAKAGIVESYDFTCRHPGCGWKMSFAPPVDRELVYCPTHDWKAWCTPQVKKVRWYDLRHMAASFHRLAGADRLAVKLLVGHFGGDITDDVYTHMGEEWLRRELSKLQLDSGSPLLPANANTFTGR